MSRLRDLLARSWAFLLRDLREAMSYRLAFAMQFYGIFFSVTLFYFIAKIFGSAVLPALERYGGSYFEFVLIGLAFIGFMTTGMHAFAASIRHGQVTGTLEAMLVTPTSLSTIVIASSLWAFMRSALNVVVYLAFGALYGYDLGDANWLGAALIVTLSVTAFAGIGIVSAAFVIAFKRGDPTAAIFGAMSGLLSGVYFPVELLPDWLRLLSKTLPLTYSLEGMRAAMRGESVAELRVEILALTAFTAVILPLAVVGFRVAVRRAKRDGSLAQY